MARAPATYRFKSIQTFFLAAITLLIAVLSLPLLLSGVTIINDITWQFGSEILQEEIESLIAPIDNRYQTLARVGLEDSITHRREIRQEALQTLRHYHYKKTGRAFVINQDGSIALSPDFSDTSAAEFSAFFSKLNHDSTTIDYAVGNTKRIAVVHYYPPWQSYVGLAIDRQELFAPRDLFVKINIAVLVVVLAIALLFTLAIHHFLITPIIRLTRFADRLSKNDLQATVQGNFILELATLKQDIMRMVTALISREEKYRAVFNAPSDTILIHEADTGRILEVNEGIEEMYGYCRKEARDLRIDDLSAGYHPYTMAEAAKRVAAASKQGDQRFEWHARRKNGELFWVDVSLRAFQYGDQQCVLAMVRDIEAQKQAALELAAEKEQLAITLRSIGDGVITTDDEGKVVLVNRVAEQLTGWRQEEAAGKPLAEVLHIIDARNGRTCPNPATEVLQSGRQIELANHTVLVARDGSRRHIADSAAPIYNPTSMVVGVVLVFRDVTDKQRMEKELLKIKKLESVGVLAGGIAHDFNNLLAAIVGNINLARIETKEAPHLDQLLMEAEKASLRAQNLTQQLLTFSKGGEPIRHTADLAEIIRENASFVLRGTPIGFEFKPAADLWPVDIDAGQIGQVIQNIVLNARQAMTHQGDLITIEARNCQECTEPEMHAGTCVHVSIRDNGPGMEATLLDRIFDPYFTTKEKGSGLGLAICHSIITKHDGVLLAHSTPNHGSEFIIKLPIAQKGQENIAAAAGAKSFVGSLKILIMDDEEMLRTLAMEIFGSMGHTPHTVADGTAAVAAYKEAMTQDAPYDLVIMDLTIPGGMGGKEAVREIRALDPAAKVVVASGYSNDPVMANYQKYGFVDMLVKPFRIPDLEKVIDNIF